MIVGLYIKDFAIVKSLDLTLDKGMTIFSGETGAGKSIIINALNLALGGRADTKIMRPGVEQSEITAVFDITDIPLAQRWLQQQELAAVEECIIRRTIKSDGRSRSTINGVPYPQQAVRDFGELLVNIHGQNEQQGLLRRERQRELLDDFAGNQQLLKQLKQAFKTWQQTHTELTKLQHEVEDYQAKSELITYQVQELEELALQADELATLHGEHKQLVNAEQLLQDCTQAIELLENNKLTAAKTAIEKFSQINASIASAEELINTALIQAQEASAELQQYLATANLNPQRLPQVEQRLHRIYDIARKHRVQPEELYELYSKLTVKLQELTNSHGKLATLQEQEQQLAEQYTNIVAKLSKSRQKAASKFSNQVVAQMQLLNMQHAALEVACVTPEAKPFSVHGAEEVEFLVTTNPGQPLRPLTKVASGGELSRISLAIQVISMQKTGMPTLIFDEVDVGIGGKTAHIVGKLLGQLGAKTQVFCITHLPQVAVYGHNHMLVDKQVIDNVTTSTVQTLDQQQREQEVARMLSGAKISAQTLAHAQEMLANAHTEVS